MKDGDIVEIDTDDGSKYVLRREGNVYSCSCRYWSEQGVQEYRRTCPHLKNLLGEAAESQRVGPTRVHVLENKPRPRGVLRNDLLDQIEVLIADGRFDEAQELLGVMSKQINRFEAVLSFGQAAQLEKDIARYVLLKNKLREPYLSDNLDPLKLAIDEKMSQAKKAEDE